MALALTALCTIQSLGRKWTFKAKQCLKRVQVLNETHLLIADVTASFVLEIKSGSTSRRFAHDLLQIPKSCRKDI